MEGNIVRRSGTIVKNLFVAAVGVGAVWMLPLTSFAELPIIGVGTHLRQSAAGPAPRIALLSDLGVSSFRDDYHWEWVEKERGVLAMPAGVNDLNGTVDAFATNDGALIILDYGNHLYGTGGLPQTPDEVAAFARYAGFVANAFKSKVRMFEIWNEWNIGAGSKPARRVGDAGEYVTLLRAASEAIRRAHPTAKIIAGSVANMDDPWISSIIEKGALNYSDGISVHPYNHCAKPPDATPEASIAYLDKLETKLTSATGRNTVPIYVTEIGWPTHTGRCGVSPQVAANYLVRFYLAAAARSFVKGVWWYDLWNDGPDPANREHNFGLVTAEKLPKPAFHALRNTTTILKSVNVVEAVSTPAGIRAVLLKRNDGSAAVVAWSESDSASWRIALNNKGSAKSAVGWKRLATEGMATQSNTMLGGGKLNVRVGAEPVAVDANFSNVTYSFVQATSGAPLSPRGLQLQ